MLQLEQGQTRNRWLNWRGFIPYARLLWLQHWRQTKLSPCDVDGGWGGVSWTLLQGWNEVCAQAAGCTLFARQLVLVFIIYHVIYHYLINIYYTRFFGAWTLYTETKPWRQIKQQAVRYHNSKLHPRANLRLLRQVLANASFDDFLLPSCGDVVASLLGWVSSSIWAKFLTENPGNMNRNSGVFL